MELINYIIQIIVSMGIFIFLCFLYKGLKKIISPHEDTIMNPIEFFPREELLTLNQIHYLILILLIYIIIINFCFGRYFTNSAEMIIFNSILDICISIAIVFTFYGDPIKSKILILFIIPLPSISQLVFGGTLLGYWNFIRILALIYIVIISYRKFLEFSEKNQLGKLILILVSIIFTGVVFTILFEGENPVNSLAMVTHVFTSNGYMVPSNSTGGVVTSTLLAWSGYILSGVATATLAAEIVHRRSKKKFEKLEDKIDNLEKILTRYQEEEKKADDE